MGVPRIKGGETWSTGYCKYKDPDGDFFIVEWNGPSGEKALPWKFTQGFGKWKSIKGEGTVQRVTKGKPIAEGTMQFCTKIKGTYELPQ